MDPKCEPVLIFASVPNHKICKIKILIINSYYEVLDSLITEQPLYL